MICGSGRSGSTYFCRLLASTGLLGNPREYFNLWAGRRHDPDYPASPRKQLSRVLSAGVTGNGIYGLKVFPNHLEPLEPKIDLFRDLPNLAVVRLVRQDLLGQAISLARAQQTWGWDDVPQLEYPVYDRQQIRACIARITREARFWSERLGSRGFDPLVVTYEEICADPQRVVDQVAMLVDIRLPVPINPRVVSDRVKRDAISAEWRLQFLADTVDEFRHLASTPDKT